MVRPGRETLTLTLTPTPTLTLTLALTPTAQLGFDEMTFSAVGLLGSAGSVLGNWIFRVWLLSAPWHLLFASTVRSRHPNANPNPNPIPNPTPNPSPNPSPNRHLLFAPTASIASAASALQLLLMFRDPSSGLTLCGRLGLPEVAFALGDDVVVATANQLLAMPLLVLMARLCPPGAEGTTYALVTTRALDRSAPWP